jgi:hypothetical protein
VRSVRIAALVAVAGFVAAWIVYQQAYQRGSARAVAWRDLTAELGPVPFPRPAGRVFRTREQFADFMRDSVPGRAPALPRIDFRRFEAVLVAAGPRSSTGYDLRVLRVVEQRGRLVVEVRERTPGLGDSTRAELTYPYRLIAVQAGDKPVFLHWQGRP